MNVDSDCAKEAYFSTETGRVYRISSLGDSDERPDDFEESDQYLNLPNKYDVELRSELVQKFTFVQNADLQEKIEITFHRRGAYRHFRYVLEENDLLECRRTFEEEHTKEGITRWCKKSWNLPRLC